MKCVKSYSSLLTVDVGAAVAATRTAATAAAAAKEVAVETGVSRCALDQCYQWIVGPATYCDYPTAGSIVLLH